MGGREIAAHRVLLALFSDHFRAMFSAGMRESFENRVPIQGVPYDAFRAMLNFLYSGQLEDPVRPDAVSWYLDLLLAADQFCVEYLKMVCETASPSSSQRRMWRRCFTMRTSRTPRS